MKGTIVMIHGMYCASWCWEKYIPYFEERGWRCIAPTLRHHEQMPGEPPPPELGTTSLLDYASDLEALTNTLDEPPILMGHSMGGLLAQIVATRTNPRAVVLLTPAPPSGVFVLKPSVVFSFVGALMRWGFWRKPQYPSYGGAVYSTLNLVPEEERRGIFKRFVPESGRAVAEIGLPFLDGKRAAKVDETQINSPMLVIGSELDRIVPASVVRNVARKYRRVAEHRELEGHAHWVLGEPGWEGIAAHVADWLESV